MVSVIKEILESTFEDKANIYIMKNIEKDGVVVGDEIILFLENISCSISNVVNDTAVETKTATVASKIKVFLSNSYDIPINSIIEIKHCNRVIKALHTSNSKIYDTHQEIICEVIENA